MRGDNFVALVTVIALCLIVPYGCMPRQTQDFLSNHSYLSSWAQAVGSLLAIWATFSIFQKQNIESNKKKKIEEEKASLKGETHLLKNNELRRNFVKLKSFAERCKRYKKNRGADKYIYAYFVANDFLSLGIKEFGEKDFDILVDAFGEQIVSLQRAIIKLECYSNFALGEANIINDMIDGEAEKLKSNIVSQCEMIDLDIRCIEVVSNNLYSKYTLFG